MTASFWITLLLFFVDWVAVWRNWKRVRWFTKPAALIALILWFTQSGGWQGAAVWFGGGLIFSLLGDIFLMLPVSFFLAGVGAFLLAHVLYIIGFSQSALMLQWTALLPIALVAVAFWLLTRKVRAGLHAHHESKMVIPVMVYATILSLMLLSALSTLYRPTWQGISVLLACLGGTLFFISDSVLSYNRFVRPLPMGDLIVMVTYHLGQLLLTASVLTHFSLI